MSPLEIAGTILGILNIVLLIRRSVWNYPAGLLMVTVYAKVFYDARLYSDVLLQIFFFGVQVWGWRVWLAARSADGEIVARRLTRVGMAVTAGATPLGIAALGGAMALWTDAALPFWDAAIAGISVTAQILLSLRYIENWMLWILADAIAVGVYLTKDLHLTAGLYALFLGLAVMGLQSWRRHSAPVPAVA